jgi:hypothetical protein
MDMEQMVKNCETLLSYYDKLLENIKDVDVKTTTFDYAHWPRKHKLKMSDVRNIRNGKGTGIYVVGLQQASHKVLFMDQEQDTMIKDGGFYVNARRRESRYKDKVVEFSGGVANIYFKLSLPFLQYLEEKCQILQLYLAKTTKNRRKEDQASSQTEVDKKVNGCEGTNKKTKIKCKLNRKGDTQFCHLHQLSEK